MPPGNFVQIPPDFVVKSQAADIVEVIVSEIRRQNVSQRLWSNRNSRGELLSTSEAHWLAWITAPATFGHAE